MNISAKSLRFILGVVISLVFLWFAFKDVNLPGLVSALTSANLVLMSVGLIIWLLGYIVRAYRWEIFLSSISKTRVVDSLRVLLVGFAANNVLPFRVGELVRSYVLHRVNPPISTSSAFATVVGERIFDGITVVTYAIIGALTLTLPVWARNAVIGGGIMFGGLFLVFVGAVLKPALSDRLLLFVTRLIPFGLGNLVYRLAHNFLIGLSALSSFSAISKMLIFSFIAWGMEVVFYFLVTHSLGMSVTWGEAAFLMGMINLAVMIPAAPGGIGAYQFISLQVLVLAGFGQENALAFGVTGNVLQNLSVIILGLIAMWTLKLSVGELRREINA